MEASAEAAPAAEKAPAKKTAARKPRTKMCIRDRGHAVHGQQTQAGLGVPLVDVVVDREADGIGAVVVGCLLYTSEL